MDKSALAAMTVIQTLPQTLVHRIAAGEVIDSLAALVRELVENAIDAQANRLNLAIAASGVVLSDNGWGMDLANLERAALPHATSKIQSEQDLWDLRSLGFRGEALFSLAQLADLQICSRGGAADLGWQVAYDRSGIPKNPPRQIAIAPGTIVTVQNLFSPMPARAQALPAMPQQLRQVQTLIYQMAIANPHLSWQVSLSANHQFTIYAGTEPQHILPQVLPRLHPQDLLSDRLGEVQVTLGLPDRLSRRRPDWVKLIINGRMVQVPELEQTILGAFANTLPRHRYPLCIVNLQVPPNLLDWNRDPAKTEIYLQNLPSWQAQVRSLIDQLLRSPLGSPLANSAAASQVLKLSERQGRYLTRSPETILEPTVKAIAQIHQTYILAEHDHDIWLVEQHVAHERVLFEAIEQEWQVQPIDPPILLDQILPIGIERLQDLGIEIEEFGETTWLVRSLPQLLLTKMELAEIPSILREISQQADAATAKATAACRSAIRNGTILSLEEMQALLNQWQQSRNPRTCPHGRPICLTLDSDRLARFFRRNWLVK